VLQSSTAERYTADKPILFTVLQHLAQTVCNSKLYCVCNACELVHPFGEVPLMYL